LDATFSDRRRWSISPACSGPAGLRIEETARLVDQVEQVDSTGGFAKGNQYVLDNIGLAYSGINLSYSNGGTIGTSDAEILVSLKPGHEATETVRTSTPRELPKDFPGIEFFFSLRHCQSDSELRATRAY